MIEAGIIFALSKKENFLTDFFILQALLLQMIFYNDETNTIYLLFINNNHFNYLDLIIEKNENRKDKISDIGNMLKINLKELAKIRKKNTL